MSRIEKKALKAVMTVEKRVIADVTTAENGRLPSQVYDALTKDGYGSMEIRTAVSRLYGRGEIEVGNDLKIRAKRAG